MRCIEITDNPTYIRLLYRLTLTWDVLKSKDLATLTQGKKININMRCIEMLFFEGHSPTTTAININMRCIEMLKKAKANLMQLRLTLTWDVLKYEKCFVNMFYGCWLTLTWDVLKWIFQCPCKILHWININMRCIEILHSRSGWIHYIWLTLTWDVLKLLLSYRFFYYCWNA